MRPRGHRPRTLLRPAQLREDDGEALWGPNVRVVPPGSDWAGRDATGTFGITGDSSRRPPAPGETASGRQPRPRAAAPACCGSGRWTALTRGLTVVRAEVVLLERDRLAGALAEGIGLRLLVGRRRVGG